MFPTTTAAVSASSSPTRRPKHPSAEDAREALDEVGELISFAHNCLVADSSFFEFLEGAIRRKLHLTPATRSPPR